MSDTEMAVVPDSIEPFVGFKYLRVQDDGRLLSPLNDMEWPCHSRIEAACESVGRQNTWQAVKTSTAATIWTWSTTSPPPLILPQGYGWRWQEAIHEVVQDDCTCGIYAVETADACAGYRAPTSVLVEVAMWGRVVIGDRGARGQYAYPQRIIAPPAMEEQALKAGLAYVVPVEIAELPEGGPNATSVSHIVNGGGGNSFTIMPDVSKKKELPWWGWITYWMLAFGLFFAIVFYAEVAWRWLT